MSTFDLRAPNLRILECTRCHEPVAGEGGGPRVELHCGACGFEDARELSVGGASASAAQPYRGGRGKGRTRIRADLSEPLEGMPAQPTLGDLHARFHAALGALDEDVREVTEHRVTWLAAVVSAQRTVGRDFLRARAVLETALEAVTLPAFRALVLARLARLAAQAHAQELGRRWLALAPEGVRIAEVESDLRIAEALLARDRGDERAVLAIVGERNTADEFVGGARWLALALRVDAYERAGDGRLARLLWRESAKGGAATPLAQTAMLWGLAPRTRTRVARSAVVFLAAFVGVLWAAFELCRPLFDAGAPRLEVVAVSGVVFVAAWVYAAR